MRRSIPTLLLIAATLAATACGDNSLTSPSAGLRPSFSGYVLGGGEDGSASTLSSVNTGTATFVPEGGFVTFGTFTVTYRAGSVSLCQADGSGCNPITAPVSVSVTWSATAIDFGTTDKGLHINFAAPGARLSTSAFATSWKSILASGQHVGLLYAPIFGAASEPHASKSHFDPTTGDLWRWVRHFSGYVLGGGFCDPLMDPTCAPLPDAQ